VEERDTRRQQVRRWSLTARFAVVSLVAVVLLGTAVSLVVQRVVVGAATAEAARSGKLLGQFVSEGISPQSLVSGLTSQQVEHLDRSTDQRLGGGQLRNILLYGPGGRVLYDGKHEHDGDTMPVGGQLAAAYAGRLGSEVEHDEGLEHPEQGSLLEVYVPLELRTAAGERAVLEVYLAYGDTAARAERATRLIGLVLLVGLAALWALMWWLSVTVNRRLRRQSEVNEHLARHDGLTGLANRRLLTAQVAEHVRSGAPGALVLLDLDRFKEVNDALGHSVGDELLKQVAVRLDGAGDLVARLGGDEFAVFLRTLPPGVSADQLGRRVAAAFEEPFLVGGVLLDVDASIGVALTPQHAQDAEALLQRADVAMYAAKNSHTLVAEYDPAADVGSLEGLSLLGELRTAVGGDGGLHLLYQPTVSLQTDEVVGVEALLRWQHPTRGLVPPADFIPLAERTGLIAPLTEHVLDLALRQCRAWVDAGLRLPVAVNLSARNLLEADLPVRVASALERHGVPAQLLVLEITESAVVEDPVRAEQVVRALVAQGVRIAIDDFGTGYSSMVWLTRLPLDCLKVDRTFVADLDTGGPGAVIATTSIRLAHDLGLRVVAEGVETAEQLERLRALGCDVAQGFLLARPMAPEQVPPFARARSGSLARG
jgi:diguanylate cyclase (GGDEF)-like protein